MRWFHRKLLNPLIFKALRRQKETSKNYQKWLDKSSPKGENLRSTGWLLRRKGYQIRVLDLIQMERSHCYNPFVYLRDGMVNIDLLGGRNRKELQFN